VDVIFVNSEEAAYLLREIISRCEGLNEQTVILMPANGDNVLTQECQICIQTSVSLRNFQLTKNLRKKANFTDVTALDSFDQYMILSR
jgi:hypothetical protein